MESVTPVVQNQPAGNQPTASDAFATQNSFMDSGGVSAYKATWHVCGGCICLNQYCIFPPRVCYMEEFCICCCCFGYDCACPTAAMPTMPATLSFQLLDVLAIPGCMMHVKNARTPKEDYCCGATMDKIRVNTWPLRALIMLPMDLSEIACCSTLENLYPTANILNPAAESNPHVYGKKRNMIVLGGFCCPGLCAINCYLKRPAFPCFGCEGGSSCCCGCDCGFPCSDSIPSTFGCCGCITKCYYCTSVYNIVKRIDEDGGSSAGNFNRTA